MHTLEFTHAACPPFPASPRRHPPAVPLQDSFLLGLQQYLQRYAYNSTTAPDLWQALVGERRVVAVGRGVEQRRGFVFRYMLHHAVQWCAVLHRTVPEAVRAVLSGLF